MSDSGNRFLDRLNEIRSHAKMWERRHDSFFLGFAMAFILAKGLDKEFCDQLASTLDRNKDYGAKPIAES